MLFLSICLVSVRISVCTMRKCSFKWCLQIGCLQNYMTKLILTNLLTILLVDKIELPHNDWRCRVWRHMTLVYCHFFHLSIVRTKTATFSCPIYIGHTSNELIESISTLKSARRPFSLWSSESICKQNFNLIWTCVSRHGDDGTLILMDIVNAFSEQTHPNKTHKNKNKKYLTIKQLRFRCCPLIFRGP